MTLSRFSRQRKAGGVITRKPAKEKAAKRFWSGVRLRPVEINILRHAGSGASALTTCRARPPARGLQAASIGGGTRCHHCPAGLRTAKRRQHRAPNRLHPGAVRGCALRGETRAKPTPAAAATNRGAAEARTQPDGRISVIAPIFLPHHSRPSFTGTSDLGIGQTS